MMHRSEVWIFCLVIGVALDRGRWLFVACLVFAVALLVWVRRKHGGPIHRAPGVERVMR